MNIRNSHQQESERPLVIGVTGGVGSGKSLVCTRFRELGVPVQSADQLAKQAVEPGTGAYDQIVKHFGEQILAPDGSIDRPALRGIIVRDDNARKALESFIHPEVFKQMTDFVHESGKQGAQMAAVEVPLLFETGMQSFFDYVVMVGSSRENRIRRIMERDDQTRDQAEALMKTQMPEDEKRRLADFVIENNRDRRNLLAEVDRIYGRLKKACKKNWEKA